jgi:hypothetical protein
MVSVLGARAPLMMASRRGELTTALLCRVSSCTTSIPCGTLSLARLRSFELMPRVGVRVFRERERRLDSRGRARYVARIRWHTNDFDRMLVRGG